MYYILKPKLGKHLLETAGMLRAMPAGVCELFAYRFSKAAGVRVAKVCLTAEQPASFDDFVKRVPGGWVVSKRIKSSIPLYFLTDKCHAVDPNGFDSYRRHFTVLFDKRCPHGRETYSDFPEIPAQRVLDAAVWNSPERIKGHCFRAMLNSSYGHTSNCLIDVKGILTMIDFEKLLYREDVDDIAKLHSLVKGNAVVMDACRQIATVTEIDIKKSLAGIPKVFWKSGGGVFDNEKDAADYFCRRLGEWKKHFGSGC
jgi:hypothetical protein